jgi:hypothetical protein
VKILADQWPPQSIPLVIRAFSAICSCILAIDGDTLTDGSDTSTVDGGTSTFDSCTLTVDGYPMTVGSNICTVDGSTLAADNSTRMFDSGTLGSATAPQRPAAS